MKLKIEFDICEKELARITCLGGQIASNQYLASSQKIEKDSAHAQNWSTYLGIVTTVLPIFLKDFLPGQPKESTTDEAKATEATGSATEAPGAPGAL